MQYSSAVRYKKSNCCVAQFQIRIVHLQVDNIESFSVHSPLSCFSNTLLHSQCIKSLCSSFHWLYTLIHLKVPHLGGLLGWGIVRMSANTSAIPPPHNTASSLIAALAGFSQPGCLQDLLPGFVTMVTGRGRPSLFPQIFFCPPPLLLSISPFILFISQIFIIRLQLFNLLLFIY